MAIIDKTLDEMQDVYIREIRLGGGEPMLNPGAIDYLVDQIITRRIKASHAVIFTNATVKSDRIKTALMRFADYVLSDYGKSFVAEINMLDNPDDLRFTYYQDDKLHSPVSVILSSVGHDNQSVYTDTIEFYRVPDRICSIEQIANEGDPLQWSLDDTVLILEGNASKNYNLWSSDILKNVRVISNKFCIVNDFDPSVIMVRKTLSVSVDGDVFAGCSASYEREQKERLFNILECNNSFFEKVGAWCWEHPVNAQCDKIRSQVLSKQWKMEHNIPLNDFERVYLDPIAAIVESVERQAKRLHSRFYFLGHIEILIAAFQSWHMSIIDFFSANPAKRIDADAFREICHKLGYDISPGEEYSINRYLQMQATLQELEARNEKYRRREVDRINRQIEEYERLQASQTQ